MMIQQIEIVTITLNVQGTYPYLDRCRNSSISCNYVLMIKPFIGNADFKEQIINETQKQGNQVSITEINNGMDALGSLFNFFTWGAFIPLILAIIGGILINKT